MMKKILLFICCIILFSCTNTNVGKTEVFMTSMDFVKEQLSYPKEADFERYSYVFEDYGEGNYTILAKFSAPNAYGVKSEYVYKIQLRYNGGDWMDLHNWICSSLTIEDIVSGEQYISQKANAKAQIYANEPTSEKDRYIEYTSLNCKIIEDGDLFIRILTPKKLTESEIKLGAKSFSLAKSKIVYFHLAGKTKRGEDYASYVPNKDTTGEVYMIY